MEREILARLDMLAQKLGQTTEGLWPYLVQDALVIGVMRLVFGIMLCLAGCYAVRRARIAAGTVTHDSEKSLFLTFGWAALVMTWVVGVMSIMSGVRISLSPEAYALKQLINMF